MLRTFVIVCIGYVFDVAPSFRQAMWTFKELLINQKIKHILGQIFSLGLNEIDLIILFFGALTILIVSYSQEKTNSSVSVLLDRKRFVIRYLYWVIIPTMTMIFGIYGPGYSPAEFVYMQF